MGWNYGWTDKRTDGRTDDPNTRCPRRTFQAGGIKSYSHSTFPQWQPKTGMLQIWRVIFIGGHPLRKAVRHLSLKKLVIIFMWFDKGHVVINSLKITWIFHVANSRIIESITTLWKGQGNPIRVSMICNPQRGLPSCGCCKSWTRGWDSLVPATMWWLIIFLPRLLFLINNPISTSF